MTWQTISIHDIEEPKGYTFEAHAWMKFKRLPWEYCRKCGLIGVRNPFTSWCIKKGCNNAEHSEYKKVRNSLT